MNHLVYLFIFSFDSDVIWRNAAWASLIVPCHLWQGCALLTNQAHREPHFKRAVKELQCLDLLSSAMPQTPCPSYLHVSLESQPQCQQENPLELLIPSLL